MDVTALMARWNLTADGDLLRTPSSDVVPVQYRGQPAMLKVARDDEEIRGHRLMAWLDGDGAARVFRHEHSALLMERLEGSPALAGMVATDDDGATRILVQAAQAVHRERARPWPELPSLRTWFRALEAASAGGGAYAAAWNVARSLLDDPHDVCPLHGDIHHGNVLWSPERGWLVIDPKGLIGESGYDYANMLCNPTLDHALSPGRLERQIEVIVRVGGPERWRLLAWVQAYAGLSAAWTAQDGNAAHAARTLELSQLAAGLLSRRGN